MHNRAICSHKGKHLLGIIKTKSNIICGRAPLPLCPFLRPSEISLFSLNALKPHEQNEVQGKHGLDKLHTAG